MQITILTVPDCPNAPLLAARVEAARDGQPVRVEIVEIADDHLATRWGMAGSPTLLVDGIDPFARPGVEPSVSCRLYPTPHGTNDGAPGVAELRAALLAAPVADQGQETWIDSAGRAGRGRLAPTARGLRATQQAVLQSLGTTGHVPGDAELDRLAATYFRSTAAVLHELADEDFLSLDDRGAIRAAYPFSVVPTRHRVVVRDGPSVWSMCAIDALGIAPMLGRHVTITSTDPISDETVTIHAGPGAAEWSPADAVVFAGRNSGQGPAETACCGTINFFASRGSAARWAALHPEVSGSVLDQRSAFALGSAIFGRLLER